MSEEFIARIRKEGKITIPKHIRNHMELNEGDLIEINIIRKFKSVK